MKWKKRIAAATLAAMCLLSACDGINLKPGGESKPVDNVKVSDAYFGMAWYQNGTLNPVTDSTSINRLLCEAMYEGLFEITDSFTTQNVLCADYSGDGTTFTFTLRDDVVFWSGEPLTASDVVASLQTARFDEKSPYHNRLVEVSTIEEVSRNEVRIQLSSPNVNFPHMLDIPIYRDGSGTSGDFADGTGPFRPVKEDDSWKLVPHDNWHGGFLGTIRQITIIPMLRADAAETSFQTGDVSIMRMPRIAPEGAETMIGGSLDTIRTPSAGLHYIGINHRSEKLSKPKVRQALSAALDRQSLCDTQLQTYASPAVLPVYPQPEGGNVELNMAPNVTKAMRLLQEGLSGKDDDTDDADDNTDDADADAEGGDDNADGDSTDNGDSSDNEDGDPNSDTDSTADEDGDTNSDTDSSDSTDSSEDGSTDNNDAPPYNVDMSIRLLVNSNNLFKLAAAEQIAACWKALGISVTVDKQPYDSYVAKLQSGDFDVYYGETLLTPDFDLRPLISSGGSLNYGGYASEEMSRALMSARSGEDVTAYYSLFAEKMPIIPLAFEYGQVVIRKGLINNFSPAPYNVFAGQENWTMPE